VKALIHPDDWEQVLRPLGKVFQTAQPHQTEFRVSRPDGELRWCQATAVASKDAVGRTVRMSGVTLDITARKAAEERQELLTREVDHLSSKRTHGSAIHSTLE
jgi:PAS domain S-box-containing protein